MSQIDADQKNTTAVIDELAAAMGRPLTDIEKLSVTAAMYQKQHDDLLAACEALLQIAELAQIYAPGELAEGAHEMGKSISMARAAIAAAKGETS